jgi:DNA invertase Pin-like site-specific DNA recombinase
MVWKLDRLGRDLRHLINTVHDLTGRGIGLKVLTGHGAAIDTTTPPASWSSASSPRWPSSSAN